MSYGFIFPKQGKTINAGVKDLSWRDDQKIFLAKERVVKELTVPSGTDMNNSYLNLDIPVTAFDLYVYKAFITDNDKTVQIDTSAYTTIGGRSFLITSYLYQKDQQTVCVRANFKAHGSGVISSTQNLKLSVYLCLQRMGAN